MIILDACRFDFFKKIYKEYINGKFEKRLSKGSNTGEWLVRTFPNNYNYIYISANPLINSYGVPLNKCHADYKNYSWNAIEHFSKIIDVWDFGWNKEFHIIHPIEVNKAYLSNKDNNRTIIHYMQPHIPYLSYEIYDCKQIIYIIRNRIKNIINPVLVRKTSNYENKLTYMFYLFLTLFLSFTKRIRMKISRKKSLYYYEDNLRIVLKSISNLIDDLDGKTVITSDHGEAFGEQGIWEHPLETHIPVLIEVPWLEVKS
ncbi:hypothetical protein ES703_44176 [subsurface metagenome]